MFHELKIFHSEGIEYHRGLMTEFYEMSSNLLTSKDAFHTSNNTLTEAKIMIERWRVHYNTIRPHTSLGYRPPAPETIQIQNTNMNYEN